MCCSQHVAPADSVSNDKMHMLPIIMKSDQPKRKHFVHFCHVIYEGQADLLSVIFLNTGSDTEAVILTELEQQSKDRLPVLMMAICEETTAKHPAHTHGWGNFSAKAVGQFCLRNQAQI